MERHRGVASWPSPGLGTDLGAARDRAYGRMARITFDGMQVRRDIAWRAPGAGLASYAAAGVDIDEGTRAVDEMKAAVEATHDTPGEGVLKGVGSFGGVFSAAGIQAMDQPVLVASTDGVGTKVELAARLGMVRGVGMDIVNHCIDDVLVQSARPLFFLDYIAASVLDADLVAEVVGGMADACKAAGCALLGGETAEMPGVYQPGSFDIAGTLIGVAERSELLPRDDVAAGDVLIGIASSGPHTNGYSMLRKIFEWAPMDMCPTGFDRPLGETLLEPHRSYLDLLTPTFETGAVKALAHITGGGLPENLPRVLPDNVDANITLGSWPSPPLFRACPRGDAADGHRSSCTGPSTWASAWLSCALLNSETCASIDRRDHVGHRRTDDRAGLHERKSGVDMIGEQPERRREQRLVVMVSGNGSNLQAVIAGCAEQCHRCRGRAVSCQTRRRVCPCAYAGG